MILYFLTFFTLIGTLIYASLCDIDKRIVPFEVWYPAITCMILSTSMYLLTNPLNLSLILITIITVVVFWICGKFGLFGGADAWALIIITISSISIPIISILDNTHDGIGISTYINAFILLSLAYIVEKYIIKNNCYKKAPFIPYITIGFIITVMFGNIWNYIVGVIL